ncbi:biopolymer transporter ExbD [Vitiosangium sp. GDMCC 1.1324]|uniref:ExbD/TolR family protein n=1 Tax=Vitiosangium sp. (strain GDMCC 1.1324) TaxID=2138576 RepID=UPI000D367D72|nr:biopolymer transporter ExbD [Vitiosangium sp. GDMCC 1.1324]PTL79417.1 biopolymer transporter ExbD [Vitiosangium sp. GDMCC 1.1324]
MRTHKKMLVLPQGQANADINVTPLVDVVLVLLIIFMVVTPLMEKDIEVKLPQTSDETESVSPETRQVVVAVGPEGLLSLNNEPVSEADYIPRLRRVLAARAAGDRLLFFTADDRAPYGKVVAALDGAKEAGAEVLGLMTSPP